MVLIALSASVNVTAVAMTVAPPQTPEPPGTGVTCANCRTPVGAPDATPSSISLGCGSFEGTLGSRVSADVGSDNHRLSSDSSDQISSDMTHRVPAPIWVTGLLIPKPINGGWSTICHPWATGSPPRVPPAARRRSGSRSRSRVFVDLAVTIRTHHASAPRRRRGAVDPHPMDPWVDSACHLTVRFHLG